jgi:hypothetical protein
MALGADAAGVTRLLARHGVRLVLVGGAIGVVVLLLAARFLSTLLFGVGTFDPVALTGAPLVLGVAAWLAAYLPARRATRGSGRGSARRVIEGVNARGTAFAFAALHAEALSLSQLSAFERRPAYVRAVPPSD